MSLSIVLPCHDEAAVLPELFTRLDAVLAELKADVEVVCVDDGSTDGTWDVIKAKTDSDPRYRGLRLSRNFGHQVALTAGLWAARGDAVITMDSDLQHPPEMIGELLAKGDEGYDVVTAVRESEDVEGWFKISSARFFYWLLNRLTALDLPHGGADFRYMTRHVVDSLLRMPERHRFLRGLTRWIGFKQTTIEYSRAPRHGGRSKYTLRNMMRFAFDAIVAFSAVPLKVASVLGLVVSALGGFYGLYVIGVWVFADAVVPGWTSVAIAVIVLGGVQLACIGIIGQYLGRMYEEIKGRPLFIVWEDTGSSAASEEVSGMHHRNVQEALALLSQGRR